MSACGLDECAMCGCQYKDNPGSPCYKKPKKDKKIEDNLKKGVDKN